MKHQEAMVAVRLIQYRFAVAGICWPRGATDTSELEYPVLRITQAILSDLRRAQSVATTDIMPLLKTAIALCEPIIDEQTSHFLGSGYSA